MLDSGHDNILVMALHWFFFLAYQQVQRLGWAQGSVILRQAILDSRSSSRIVAPAVAANQSIRQEIPDNN